MLDSFSSLLLRTYSLVRLALSVSALGISSQNTSLVVLTQPSRVRQRQVGKGLLALNIVPKIRIGWSVSIYDGPSTVLWHYMCISRVTSTSYQGARM